MQCAMEECTAVQTHYSCFCPEHDGLCMHYGCDAKAVHGGLVCDAHEPVDGVPFRLKRVRRTIGSRRFVTCAEQGCLTPCTPPSLVCEAHDTCRNLVYTPDEVLQTCANKRHGTKPFCTTHLKCKLCDADRYCYLGLDRARVAEVNVCLAHMCRKCEGPSAPTDFRCATHAAACLHCGKARSFPSCGDHGNIGQGNDL